MLSRFRMNLFDLINDKTKALIESQSHETTINPDLMFSLFYDSLFDIITTEHCFRAIHWGNYSVWINDPSCIQTLEKHKQAFEKGISVERAIILNMEEINHITHNDEHKECFRKFCCGMNRLHLPIYFTREDWVRHKYENYFDSPLKRKLKNIPENISQGNIALFVK